MHFKVAALVEDPWCSF